jgi:hypothetical protein
MCVNAGLVSVFIDNSVTSKVISLASINNIPFDLRPWLHNCYLVTACQIATYLLLLKRWPTAETDKAETLSTHIGEVFGLNFGQDISPD